MFLQRDGLYAEVQIPLLTWTFPLGLSMVLHASDWFFRVTLATPLFMVSLGRRPPVQFGERRGRRALDR